MKLKDWLNLNRYFFSDNDLRFLIKTVLDSDSSLLPGDINLSDDVLNQLEGARGKYSNGLPLSYILGKDEFYGEEFQVTPDTLIPRPETELIVEKAIDLIKANNLTSVLDMCCGCGNIGVIIKKNTNKEMEVTLSDISLNALQLADLNKNFHNTKVNLVASNLLEGFTKKSFDMIITNPPYVESGAIAGSLKFEPKLALDGGEDGLDIIRKIVKDAHLYLKTKGFLIIEMGCDHREMFSEIIKNYKNYDVVEWIDDYSGHNRAVVLQIK